MTEGDLAKKIVDSIRARGGHAVVTHQNQMQAGQPDIDAAYQGRAIKLEVKLPGKEHTITRLQEHVLKKWEEAGAITAVVTSVSDIDDLL